MSTLTTELASLRAQVSALHAELVRYGLVVWTAGNISARVPGHDLLVIKPSGVLYDELTPESMIVCDLNGTVIDGNLAPSSDTAAHAYVYRHMPHVGGVVHTHSTYACASGCELRSQLGNAGKDAGAQIGIRDGLARPDSTTPGVNGGGALQA